MPTVELLPNSATSAAPGYAYVVERVFDPSKVAIDPKSRKRAAARSGNAKSENELSARQQAAVARRIAELERDNDPRQSIPIPGKTAPPKTQNARRIIGYQRNIKHWLDDEEAMLQQAPPPRTAATAARAATQSSRRTSVMPSIPHTPLEATPAPAGASAATPMDIDALDDDPLLSIESSLPPPVTPAELEALLSAPPLSYAASHAAPPPSNGPPPRHFCDNCGYWGKIKCLKCGARVCGLECKDAHEATRCLKWA